MGTALVLLVHEDWRSSQELLYSTGCESRVVSCSFVGGCNSLDFSI